MRKHKSESGERKLTPPISLLWKTEFEYKSNQNLDELINQLESVGKGEFRLEVEREDYPDIIHFRLETRTSRIQGMLSGLAERLNDNSVVIKGYCGVESFPLIILFLSLPVFAFLTGILFDFMGVCLFLLIYSSLLAIYYFYTKHLKRDLVDNVMPIFYE